MALLTHFSGLILASQAEADALVIHEARAAGLQVYATSAALGSHDRTMPGIVEIRNDLSDLVQRIETSHETPKIREAIRANALEHSAEKTAMSKWVSLVMEFTEA